MFGIGNAPMVIDFGPSERVLEGGGGIVIFPTNMVLGEIFPFFMWAMPFESRDKAINV